MVHGNIITRDRQREWRVREVNEGEERREGGKGEREGESA